MGTNIRPEISNKNKYWIDKHRYYELKHFCLQYPIWKKIYNTMESEGLKKTPVGLTAYIHASYHSDPTELTAMRKIFWKERMDMVERCAKLSDSLLAGYIIKGVTENRSYENLRTVDEIPCGRELYYDRYRKFFWLLSKERK